MFLMKKGHDDFYWLIESDYVYQLNLDVSKFSAYHYLYKPSNDFTIWLLEEGK